MSSENRASGDHVCPWRHAYLFDNWLRGLIHKPEKLFGDLIREGQTVLDVGCGMGFFSIRIAKMVGESGRVIAADLQPEMLRVLKRRASKKGILSRITLHQCEKDRVGVTEKIDFVLAFWAVHELPDMRAFFDEMKSLMNDGARLFIAEPKSHVTPDKYEEMKRIANEAGFTIHSEPKVRMGRAVIFQIK
jgi:ubiquinone/menaquinone biosynthesis C-methylase UbiE